MFIAYPNKPETIGSSIEKSIIELSKKDIKIKSWKALDILGSFIVDRIQEEISTNDILVADISYLNCNVTYEIGFAIGQGKTIALIRNKSLNEGTTLIRSVGIFDTIGYLEYENSQDLTGLLRTINPHPLLPENSKINTKVPVYLLETKNRTDFAIRISGRIKKARLNYRSFDPVESPRLSAHDAISQVAQSLGVVVPLLPKDTDDSVVHNLRASFISGLADGMNKVVLILQYGDDPVPVDYRDFVSIYYHPDDINKYIAEFADKMMVAFQEGKPYDLNPDSTFLQKLDFGASSAENEMRTLQEYYLKTDAYMKAYRGEAVLVVGRKGSGKSAIFLQLRDKERSKSKNVVLDLKPEGYKMLKFKELILDYLEEGTMQHTIMAFWEYVLLLEICYKILESDSIRYLQQTDIYDPYIKLQEVYKAEDYMSEGDFSERLSYLMEKVTIGYKLKYGDDINVRLSTPEITGLLYNTNIKDIRNHLMQYLKHKDRVWLLFDNIDKGWPTSGLSSADVVIIRTLIDAARKIQKNLEHERLEVFPIIFLRNDVFELLVEQTSDRQKEAKVLLDWVDGDLLRQIIKLRIDANLETKTESFEEAWRSICLRHYYGEETSQYFIERSLMRPRFLINLINQCKSFAINLNHTRIEEEDIEKGFTAYSIDLLTDISYEIRDIFPIAENILYCFMAAPPELSKKTLNQLIEDYLATDEHNEKIIDLLLWYGFLGVKIENHDIKYIYNINYSMQLFKGLMAKKKDDLIYIINPGFLPALMIDNE